MVKKKVSSVKKTGRSKNISAPKPVLKISKPVKSRGGTESEKQSKDFKPLPNVFRFSWQVILVLKQHWKILGGIIGVYLLLNLVFTSGISSLNNSVGSIRTDLASHQDNSLTTAVTGFGSLLGSGSSNNSNTGSALQSMLVVLESLVIIWALRQLLAGKIIKVKQTYYQSTYPLVPFLLVIFMIIIQLLPVTLGSVGLTLILTSILVSGAGLTIVLAVLFGALMAWSIYMISSSIFALYIVTLPDMQPRRALKSAKNLVGSRRWPILLRLVYLPIFILVAMGIVIIPLILWATFLVVPVFYILSALVLLYAHAYLYSLYRDLLA